MLDPEVSPGTTVARTVMSMEGCTTKLDPGHMHILENFAKTKKPLSGFATTVGLRFLGIGITLGNKRSRAQRVIQSSVNGRVWIFGWGDNAMFRV
jgi:hypothetical protein